MNRAADVAVAGLGLALAGPFLAAAALAIKLDDGGPVLFRQTRVGKDGKDFELVKLRSMSVGAEHLGAGFAVDQGDARITRVGRALRRLSVDELPQLWNVLRGDMLTAVPAWAACFGFAFDGLRSRFHRFSAAFVGALVLLSLVGVPFLFAASRL